MNEMETFSSIIDTAYERSISIGKSSVADTFAKIDKEILLTRDKERYILKDVRQRRIFTLEFGDLLFSRRRYYDGKNSKYVYLLDERIQIDKGKYIMKKDRVKALLFYHKFRSYSGVADIVYKGKITRQSVHNFVKQSDNIENIPKSYKCINDGILWIACDGLWLKGNKGAKDFETKNFTFFTGRKKVGKNKYELLGRNIFSFSSCTTLELVDKLTEIANCYSDVREIRIIGDGAAWIKKMANEMNSVFYIDKYHIRKKIRDVFGRTNYSRAHAIYSNEKINKTLCKNQMYKMVVNHTTGEVENKIVKSIGYLINNRNHYWLTINTPMTIGIIEAMQAHYIARYFKKQRKGWTVANSSKLINATLNEVNGSYGKLSLPIMADIEWINARTWNHRVPVFDNGYVNSTYAMLQKLTRS